jgi:hypothetical protein
MIEMCMRPLACTIDGKRKEARDLSGESKLLESLTPPKQSLNFQTPFIRFFSRSFPVGLTFWVEGAKFIKKPSQKTLT